MSQDQEVAVSLPSSPSEKKRLRVMISEATYCKQRIDDERESIKDIVTRIHEEFDIPKKLANKLINTLYKQDYDNRVSEEEDFQFMYEALMISNLNGEGTPEKKGEKASDDELNAIKEWLGKRGTDIDTDEEEDSDE